MFSGVRDVSDVITVRTPRRHARLALIRLSLGYTEVGVGAMWVHRTNAPIMAGVQGNEQIVPGNRPSILLPVAGSIAASHQLATTAPLRSTTRDDQQEQARHAPPCSE